MTAQARVSCVMNNNRSEMQHASLWLQEGGKIELTDNQAGTKEGLYYRRWKLLCPAC